MFLEEAFYIPGLFRPQGLMAAVDAGCRFTNGVLEVKRGFYPATWFSDGGLSTILKMMDRVPAEGQGPSPLGQCVLMPAPPTPPSSLTMATTTPSFPPAPPTALPAPPMGSAPPHPPAPATATVAPKRPRQKPGQGQKTCQYCGQKYTRFTSARRHQLSGQCPNMPREDVNQLRQARAHKAPHTHREGTGEEAAPGMTEHAGEEAAPTVGQHTDEDAGEGTAEGTGEETGGSAGGAGGESVGEAEDEARMLDRELAAAWMEPSFGMGQDGEAWVDWEKLSCT